MRILSIDESGSSLLEHSAHDAKLVIGHNFDLATGNAVVLTDLLTPQGVASAKAICSAELGKLASETGTPVDAAAYEGPCGDELEGSERANFTFDKDGIRLHPSLETADFALEADGVLVPWSALGGGLRARGASVRNATR